MIRKLTQEDWKQYKELRLRSLQSDPDVYFSTFDEVSKWPDGNFKSEIYSRPDSRFGYSGYFDGDSLLGYISLSGQYFVKQQHIADVFNLYVDPAARGKGVAQALVRELIETAKRDGTIEKLFLSVMGQNVPAITLYKSFGFEVYGTKHRSLKIGETYFDEVLMQLDVQK